MSSRGVATSNGRVIAGRTSACAPTGTPLAQTAFRLACPICGAILEPHGRDLLTCPDDGQQFHRVDGSWRLLTPERLDYFDRFIREYGAIRQAEGRGGDDPRYYRALPIAPAPDRFARDWAIRAKSYQAFLRHVLIPVEYRERRPLKIVDVGAGNCWLSYRLSRRGHRLAALDLSVDERDGLGAVKYYESDYLAIQADFDRLPIADGEADLVVFNASIHYASSFSRTLTEALRVLRPDGIVVVLDTPIYRAEESGQAMLREREADFTRRYGFASNAIPMEGFLTRERLDQLCAELAIDWQLIEPDYGLRWTLRPWRARLRGRREPANFAVIVGYRGAAPPGRAPRGRASALVRAIDRRRTRAWYLLSGRHRFGRVVIEQVAGLPVLVLPNVFNPALFRSGAFLADVAEATLETGQSVLDLGSGSGIGSLVAARRGCRVVAIDSNPEAVRCTQINALLNGFGARIDARQGDLFGPVVGERFDVVLFNPPFYSGEPTTLFEQSWRSDDAGERFAASLGDHVTSNGYGLLLLSSHGQPDRFLASLRLQGYVIRRIASRDYVHEQMAVYRVEPRGR